MTSFMSWVSKCVCVCVCLFVCMCVVNLWARMWLYTNGESPAHTDRDRQTHTCIQTLTLTWEHWSDCVTGVLIHTRNNKAMQLSLNCFWTLIWSEIYFPPGHVLSGLKVPKSELETGRKGEWLRWKRCGKKSTCVRVQVVVKRQMRRKERRKEVGE